MSLKALLRSEHIMHVGRFLEQFERRGHAKTPRKYDGQFTLRKAQRRQWAMVSTRLLD